MCSILVYCSEEADPSVFEELLKRVNEAETGGDPGTLSEKKLLRN